jgi:mono/diheme cytochrome c family protein
MAGGAKRVVKWLGIGVGVVLGITVLAAGSAYGVSEYRIRKTYTVPAAALAIPTDSASIARGKHVATTRGCADCHGANLGGTKFIDAPPMGVLYAANLTQGQGGLGRTYSDADWVRAIRHGVRKDGRSVLFMPSQEFTQMSDEDLALLIAYVKSLPPVDNAQAASSVGPLGRALFVAGQLPLLPAELIDHEASRPARVTAERSAAYGGYLMNTCTGCHGDGLSGGKIPGTPPEFMPAANLTPDRATGIGAWTEADFTRALREGRRPDGRALNAEFMPWKNFAHFTDDEIAAMWMYLQTLPAKPHGGR